MCVCVVIAAAVCRMHGEALHRDYNQQAVAIGELIQTFEPVLYLYCTIGISSGIILLVLHFHALLTLYCV